MSRKHSRARKNAQGDLLKIARRAFSRKSLSRKGSLWFAHEAVESIKIAQLEDAKNVHKEWIHSSSM